MVKRVYAFKTTCGDILHDSLTGYTDKLRAEGFSIFGINEGESFTTNYDLILQTRIVEIFYE